MLLRILNKLLVGLIFYVAVKLGKEELRERVTESEVLKGGGGEKERTLRNLGGGGWLKNSEGKGDGIGGSEGGEGKESKELSGGR